MQVVNYVVEKMVLDKPLDSANPDATFAPGLAGGPLSAIGDGSFRSGMKPWKLKPSIEILCNNQASGQTFWMASIDTLFLSFSDRVTHLFLCICRSYRQK